ncbi:MAG: alpha/beta hydrolase [Burkholderiaceae bacterium]
MPFYDLDDAHLFYEDTGSGSPPIVFVHGALCQHDDWRHQIPPFARRHRVLAPDLRAHGRSREQPGQIGVERFSIDVRAMLDAAGVVEPAVLVGHSMGCRVLLQIWRDAPERVAALVFVDGAYLVPTPLGDLDDDARRSRADDARRRALELFIGGGPAARLQVGFTGMFFDERFAAERDRVLDHALSLPSEVPRELMPGFAAWDVMNLESVLATVTVPALAFASTKMDGASERRPLGPNESTAWLQALSQHVPGAEIVRLHGTGHFVMLEQPALVNERIARFIDDHRLVSAG